MSFNTQGLSSVTQPALRDVCGGETCLEDRLCVLVVGLVPSSAPPVSHQHSGTSPSLVDEEDLCKHDDSEHRKEHDHDEEAEVGALSQHTGSLAGELLAAPRLEHPVECKRLKLTAVKRIVLNVGSHNGNYEVLVYYFWDVAPCSTVEIHGRFDGTNYPHLQGRRYAKQAGSKKQAALCSLLASFGCHERRQGGASPWIENERSFEKKEKYQIIIPTTRRI